MQRSCNLYLEITFSEESLTNVWPYMCKCLQGTHFKVIDDTTAPVVWRPRECQGHALPK